MRDEPRLPSWATMWATQSRRASQGQTTILTILTILPLLRSAENSPWIDRTNRMLARRPVVVSEPRTSLRCSHRLGDHRDLGDLGDLDGGGARTHGDRWRALVHRLAFLLSSPSVATLCFQFTRLFAHTLALFGGSVRVEIRSKSFSNANYKDTTTRGFIETVQLKTQHRQTTLMNQGWLLSLQNAMQADRPQRRRASSERLASVGQERMKSCWNNRGRGRGPRGPPPFGIPIFSLPQATMATLQRKIEAACNVVTDWIRPISTH